MDNIFEQDCKWQNRVLRTHKWGQDCNDRTRLKGDIDMDNPVLPLKSCSLLYVLATPSCHYKACPHLYVLTTLSGVRPLQFCPVYMPLQSYPVCPNNRPFIRTCTMTLQLSDLICSSIRTVRCICKILVLKIKLITYWVKSLKKSQFQCRNLGINQLTLS